MQSYEVEIKSLLGSEENAQNLKVHLAKVDPRLSLTSRNRQLNHYFSGGSLEELTQAVVPHLSSAAEKKLGDLATRATDFSVRTRDKDGSVFLVVKASVGTDSSANGVARIEFEESVDMVLEELDDLVRSAGFTYQAKWSREREEYVCRGVNVCLDRNAGYGWLAEFEQVVGSESELEEARRAVRALMQECGVDELPQDRLERMFAFYNAHWNEYYGTDKVFTIA